LLLFIVYLTTLFQNLRLYSVDVGGNPAASAQFILNPDSSSSEEGEIWVRNIAASSLFIAVRLKAKEYFRTAIMLLT
jgi:hypothetical protein